MSLVWNSLLKFADCWCTVSLDFHFTFYYVSAEWRKLISVCFVRLESMSTMKTQCGNNRYVHDYHSNISAMLQEDCKKLKHPRLTPCSRLAVQLRISEKMLLDAAEEYVKQRIKTWRDEHILDNQPCIWLATKCVMDCSCFEASTDILPAIWWRAMLTQAGLC